MQASADPHTEVSGNSTTTLYIVVTTTLYIVVTTTDEDTKQYFVVVEELVMIESDSFSQVLQDLISTYFTFDIAYPKQLYPVYVLLFLQHHVCTIQDQQPIPNVVKIVYSAMCT